MVPEVKVLLHVNDIVQVVFVFLLYHLQDLQLDKSLVMESAGQNIECKIQKFAGTCFTKARFKSRGNSNANQKALSPSDRETSSPLRNL